jgi:hypothetical protein
VFRGSTSELDRLGSVAVTGLAFQVLTGMLDHVVSEAELDARRDAVDVTDPVR